MYTIFVVEDHPMMLEMYEAVFAEQADMVICGMSQTGAVALQQIPTLNPDLVIVDLSLPDMNGLTLLPQLLAQLPDLKAIVVSGHYGFYKELSLQAGALAFVDKLEAADTLVPLIRSVLLAEKPA